MVYLYYSCPTPGAHLLIRTKPKVNMTSAELSASSQNLKRQETYIHLTAVIGDDFAHEKWGGDYLLIASPHV